MSEFETSQAFIPSSEEVEAYPRVLQFVSVNWIAFAVESPDKERREAFALASAYSSLVFEDLATCRAIGEISGMFDVCRRVESRQSPLRPRHF